MWDTPLSLHVSLSIFFSRLRHKTQHTAVWHRLKHLTGHDGQTEGHDEQIIYTTLYTVPILWHHTEFLTSDTDRTAGFCSRKHEQENRFSALIFSPVTVNKGISAVIRVSHVVKELLVGFISFPLWHQTLQLVDQLRLHLHTKITVYDRLQNKRERQNTS